MFSWLDTLLQILLPLALLALMLLLSKKWENERACRDADDRAAPKAEENPVDQDKSPVTGEKTQRPPEKLSVSVKIMGSDMPLVIESSPSDRVLDLKLKIEESQGTPANLQRLIFRGSPLENETDLKSCGVVDGSEMHLVSTKKPPLKLLVRKYTGTLIGVECDENATVADLKNQIGITEGLPFDKVMLIFNGRMLEDEQSLRHYYIQNFSLIHMVVRLMGGFIVNIKISDGRTLELGSFDTIGELKHKIKEETEIPVQNQILIFNGITLEDSSHREDYNIESNCTIDLIIQE